MTLTSGKLLRFMEPGRAYEASELARRLDASAAQVNNILLCTLVEDGLIRMSSHASRILRFERPPLAPDAPSRSHADTDIPTSVASPPVTRQLHGSLRGYDASLVSVRSLAMLARTSH
ncbi:UNVERIFIED_ORG: hypothetical protein ABIC62_006440 [Burkholderia sp. 1595]|uniref:Winged helix-turn-helix DNA-binding n=1 Tax=Paraburkholderia terricola TaxID=169427 RepID=A0ABU1M1U6_9BURK|nr:hypothetical protein [Paraburkholderia terricola]MDR6412979.1 hypothetical protein [Paraburkholderia terricola]